MGEFAGVLPDYHKPDILGLINSYVPVSEGGGAKDRGTGVAVHPLVSDDSSRWELQYPIHTRYSQRQNVAKIAFKYQLNLRFCLFPFIIDRNYVYMYMYASLCMYMYHTCSMQHSTVPEHCSECILSFLIPFKFASVMQ